MRVFILYFFLCLILIPNNLWAQRSESSVPFSVTFQLAPVSRFEEMPVFSTTLLMKEDRDNEERGLKTHRFAKMFNVALHPYNSGTWEETGLGRVWRLGIHSGDAASLYLVLKDFNLAPGVKLYVYNASFSALEGGFSEKNNNRFNTFTIAPVEGDSIIVELNVPSGIDDFGRFTVSRIGHDYRNEFGTSRLKSTTESADTTCEVDINCDAGQPWQNEKRAVCKLIAGGLLCTGTLINNAAGKKIPYLITAYHCIQSESVAEEGLFIFNYEHVTCNSKTVTSSQSLSGAQLVATTDHKLDFALLRLLEYPPLYYNPYFAGWDARPVEPGNGVCLHHPEGDVTKISIENHPLVTASFGEGFDTLSHWKVSHYEVGATEGGSSGSPIFNSQHRLVGTLTGGVASCSDPVDDFFTKFCLDWDKYPDSTNQVKYWLDPENKGITFVNGMDPYNKSYSVCDTFWNIPKNEYISLFTSNLKKGALSGQSSAGFTQFAEKFLNHSVIKIPGVFLNVGKVSYATAASNFNIKIWEGGDYPETEIYSTSRYLISLKKGSVNFIGFDTLITVGGNFFAGYEINYVPKDTIAVYTAENRGVNGPSTMYLYKDGVWKKVDEVSQPVLYTSLSIGLLGCDGTLDMPKSMGLKFTPNPCSTYAEVELPEGVTITHINCFNQIGKQVYLNTQFFDGRLFIYPSGLAAGVYILQLNTLSKPLTGHFIVFDNN